jgi:hypothetical protein
LANPETDWRNISISGSPVFVVSAIAVGRMSSIRLQRLLEACRIASDAVIRLA